MKFSDFTLVEYTVTGLIFVILLIISVPVYQQHLENKNADETKVETIEEKKSC